MARCSSFPSRGVCFCTSNIRWNEPAADSIGQQHRRYISRLWCPSRAHPVRQPYLASVSFHDRLKASAWPYAISTICAPCSSNVVKTRPQCEIPVPLYSSSRHNALDPCGEPNRCYPNFLPRFSYASFFPRRAMRELLAYGIIFSMNSVDRACLAIIERFSSGYIVSRFNTRDLILRQNSRVHILKIVWEFRSKYLDF